MTIFSRCQRVALVWLAIFFAGLATGQPLRAQFGEPPPGAGGQTEIMVRQVRIEGNHTTPVSKMPKLATRVDQPFDPRIVAEDVRLLASSRRFLDVKSQYQQLPGGVAVIFQVVERPTLQYLKFVGNQAIASRTLRKKSELTVGDALDPYAVEEARRRIEQIYREKGFSHIQILTVEGTKPSDKGAVYIVNEGESQKVLWTSFEGNTIANDPRLRTQIKSKPGICWLFGGKVDTKKIDDDVESLTAYYRSLGFFQAKVGRELGYDEDKDWLSLKFIINEGPRYNVRNVSFLGNEIFQTAELNKDLDLEQGKPFDQQALNRDLSAIRDVYGGQGYIFADVQADPRLLEDKPEVDLVYDIREGKRYRVGQIKVHIAGENPHTNHNTVLNRLSLRPGDIVDTRKLREDERRLRFSGLFLNDPSKGSVPKIVFSEPSDSENSPRNIAVGGGGPGFRGQSPDGHLAPGENTGGNARQDVRHWSARDTGTYRGQSPEPEEVVDVVFVRDAAGVEQLVLMPHLAPRDLARGDNTGGKGVAPQSRTVLSPVRSQTQHPVYANPWTAIHAAARQEPRPPVTKGGAR